MKYLCIGNNEYKLPGANLGGCIADAKAFSRFLSGKGYTGDTILNATASKIRSSIDSILQHNGYIVITFSGHGTQVPDLSKDEYDKYDEAICPSDLDWSNEKTWITDDYLYDKLSKAKNPEKILLIFDCCHSGSMTRLLNPTTYRNRALQGPFFPTLKSRKAKKLVLWTVLSACHDAETAADTDNGGAFTLSLLETYAKSSTWKEWLSRSSKFLKAGRFSQHPVIDSQFKDDTVWL